MDPYNVFLSTIHPKRAYYTYNPTVYWLLQVPNVRLAVARVVSQVPEVFQHNSLHLVRAAADHLQLDKDRDVQAAISRQQEEGEREGEEGGLGGC